MKSPYKKYFATYKFYFISTVVFLVWLIFFDRSNLIKQVDLYQNLNKINKEQVFYREELEKVKLEEKEVLGSTASIEKYGREKYFLKKEGETVFVIVDENNNIIK